MYEPHRANAEQRLFAAVVSRAVLDATMKKPRNGTLLAIRNEADAWFRNNGKDYRLICDKAGIDSDFIREAYIRGKLDGIREIVAAKMGEAA